MKKSSLILGLLILAFVAVGVYSYFNIDTDKIVTHWNTQNEVDGYMGKFWGVFLIPIISLVLIVLFLVVPVIDPLKKNLKKFEKHYHSFIVVLMFFLLYVYVASMMYNLGKSLNMGNIVLPGIGALFFYIGIIIKKIQPNWFMGVRTPWTLSSKKSWKKTHVLASKLFMILGLIMFAAMALPGEYAIWFILIPIFGVTLFLMFYSWLIWKKDKS